MQYRRLFSHHSRNFHWQINVLITVVAVWGGGIILTAFFLCVPMEKNWHPMVKGTCIPIIPFYYGLQIPNIITDVLIIVVPIREVMCLQLNKKLKTGAVTMFALGVITLVFDIVRLVALLQLTAPEKMADFTCESFEPQNTQHPLASWQEIKSCSTANHLPPDNVIDVAVWTTIEPTVAIVAVCIPSVRTLYRRKRQSSHYTNGSTIVGNNSSIRELKSATNESDVEAAELSSPVPSIASPAPAHQQWPPVSMLLDSERPFQRFEEFDGRQRTWTWKLRFCFLFVFSFVRTWKPDGFRIGRENLDSKRCTFLYDTMTTLMRLDYWAAAGTP
jgi:hypothetical protein